MSNVGDYCYNPKQGVSEIIGSNSNNFTYRKANNMQDEVEQITCHGLLSLIIFDT